MLLFFGLIAFYVAALCQVNRSFYQLMAKQKTLSGCPCGYGLPLAQCCQLIIEGDQPAQSALALMRSRYTAFTLVDEAYLLKSWHSSTRPTHFDLGDSPQQWLRLKILHTEMGQPADDSGVVEFVAVYKVNGKAHRLHERSRFCRENGAWRYLDGVHKKSE